MGLSCRLFKGTHHDRQSQTFPYPPRVHRTPGRLLALWSCDDKPSGVESRQVNPHPPWFAIVRFRPNDASPELIHATTVAGCGPYALIKTMSWPATSFGVVDNLIDTDCPFLGSTRIEAAAGIVSAIRPRRQPQHLPAPQHRSPSGRSGSGSPKADCSHMGISVLLCFT